MNLISNITLTVIILLSSIFSGLTYYDCSTKNTVHLYECCKSKIKSCCPTKTKQVSSTQISQLCCTQDDFKHLEATNTCDKQFNSLKIQVCYYSHTLNSLKAPKCFLSKIELKTQIIAAPRAPIYKTNCTYLC